LYRLRAYRQSRTGRGQRLGVRVVEPERHPSQCHWQKEGKSWLDGVNLIISVIVACILFGQQSMMKRQLTEMQNEQRPWIEPSISNNVNITFKGGGVLLSAEIYGENSGGMVASSAIAVYEVVNPVDGDGMYNPSVPPKVQRKVCSPVGRSIEIVGAMSGGVAVFPSRKVIIRDERSPGVINKIVGRAYGASRDVPLTLTGLTIHQFARATHRRGRGKVASSNFMMRRMPLVNQESFLRASFLG